MYLRNCARGAQLSCHFVAQVFLTFKITSGGFDIYSYKRMSISLALRIGSGGRKAEPRSTMKILISGTSYEIIL